MAEQFHERLLRLRRRKGMSQEVLAGLSGLSRSTVIKYECGDMEPKMASLIALADVFDVTIDYLTGRSEKA